MTFTPPTDEQRLLGRLRLSGFVPRFYGASIEAFDAPGRNERFARDFAKGYVSGFPEHRSSGRGAVFAGTVGTGKTLLSFAILKGLILADPAFNGRYVTISGLFRTIKDSWGPAAQRTESEAIARFVDPDLLIIDEVGVQFGSVAEANLLYEVVNGRYERVLPTIMVTNLGIPQFRKLVGDRVYDRLREGGAEVVAFDWPSRRGS